LVTFIVNRVFRSSLPPIGKIVRHGVRSSFPGLWVGWWRTRPGHGGKGRASYEFINFYL